MRVSLVGFLLSGICANWFLGCFLGCHCLAFCCGRSYGLLRSIWYLLSPSFSLCIVGHVNTVMQIRIALW